MIAAASGPSLTWYTTRGAGVALLVVLTVSLLLGIFTTLRMGGASTPRFAVAMLHRNLALIAVVLLVVHVVTTVVDPFAHIGVRDALVPFTAAYRPLWLGLGTVAAELLVAIAMSSLVRLRIGLRAWRLLHWTAYASWPIAVVHGLGTGSDAQAPWMIGLTTACVAAVLLAVAMRLLAGRRLPWVRLALGAGAAAAVAVVALWSLHGPLRPGWAAAAGTPSALLSTPTPQPARRGPFSDALVGTMVRDPDGGVQLAFRDVVDPSLTLSVRPPTSSETLPVLTVVHGTRTLCSVPARAAASLYAVCGSARLQISVFGGPGAVSGRLDSSAPLG